MKAEKERRPRAVYFWDEELYKKNKDKFLFRKPILFARHAGNKIVAVFKGDPPKSGKYTGEKLRQLRAERGVGKPPAKIAAQRQKLLEGMQA